MSELKEVEYPNCFGSYYLKSEADKVIDDLKIALLMATKILKWRTTKTNGC